MARGDAFLKYIEAKYGAKHRLVVAPQCGHSGRCVFTAPQAIPVLFPEQERR
jgi:hypothetical protein